MILLKLTADGHKASRAASLQQLSYLFPAPRHTPAGGTIFVCDALWNLWVCPSVSPSLKMI